ncbi:DUF998 domain-containing protein [Agromyces humatus]|uniref:DUF998 domain-containing protein n=1 Tax=Agromyces humatus TaxID=279573 RepID=A0ABP4WHK0_9MICO|nr:DUF998 domain-containing protein [Agromyces humatus]
MTKHTAPSPNRIRRAPALVAVFGGAGFVAFFVVAHLVQPTVDGSWQPPSELALGANGWAMTIAFLMLGVAGIGLFLALTSQVVTWPGRIGLAAILVAAIGFIVAAVFPTDPAMTPPGEMTLSGMLHSIGPVLADGIPIAAIILAVSLTRHSPQWRRVRWVLVLGAVLTVWAAVLLTVSLAVLMPATGQLGPDVPVGWQGRFLLVADAVWLAAVGGCALAIRRGPRHGASDLSAPTMSGRVS